MSKQYGKHAKRAITKAHNAAHDAMALTDRARAVARATQSPADADAARIVARREEVAKTRLMETERLRRIAPRD